MFKTRIPEPKNRRRRKSKVTTTDNNQATIREDKTNKNHSVNKKFKWIGNIRRTFRRNRFLRFRNHHDSPKNFPSERTYEEINEETIDGVEEQNDEILNKSNIKSTESQFCSIFESFINLFSSSSDTVCLSKPPRFCKDQMTCAHLDNKASDDESSSSIDPVRLCSLAFFDLDDTLIPTDWIRRAFLVTRNELSRGGLYNMTRRASAPSSSSGASDLLLSKIAIGTHSLGHSASMGTVTIDEALSPPIQNAVRLYLEQLGGHDFDERAASIIEKACLAFGVVVVVTNARSIAWLKIVSDLFPKLKAQLRRFSVPIIRAAVPPAGATTLRADFSSVNEYFQYWTKLKRLQFSRVATAAREVINQLRRTTPQVEPKQGGFRSMMRRRSTETTVASENSEMFVFRGDYEGRPSLSSLSGGELLLSPRSHSKESSELDEILRKREYYMCSIDDKLLMRIVVHQVRRFLLHHHSESHPDVMAEYSPRNLLTGSPPTFPSTPSHSQQTLDPQSFIPARNDGLPFHAVPHLPEMLRKEFAIRESMPRFHSNHEQLLFDILCVGDSEFELCAARELAMTNPQIFRGVGLIKCRAGLAPDAFRDQLDEIEAAMACISQDRQDPNVVKSGVRHLGPYVACEFTSRACGFRPDMFGLTFAEREALRFRNKPIVSPIAIPKSVNPPQQTDTWQQTNTATQQQSLPHSATITQTQRMALLPRANTESRRSRLPHAAVQRSSSYHEWNRNGRSQL